MLDVPVEFHEQNFEMSPPNMKAVTALFQELEFRRLIDNFTKTFTQTVSIAKPGFINNIHFSNYKPAIGTNRLY